MDWTYDPHTAYHESDVFIQLDDWLIVKYNVDAVGVSTEESYQLLHIVNGEAHFSCDDDDLDDAKCYKCEAQIPDAVLGFMMMCAWTLR